MLNINKQKMTNKYIIKCDECKKTIKKNVTFKESVEGGTCQDCRRDDLR